MLSLCRFENSAFVIEILFLFEMFIFSSYSSGRHLYWCYFGRYKYRQQGLGYCSRLESLDPFEGYSHGSRTNILFQKD